MDEVSNGVQLRGHRVSIVEKRRVEGRLQEWNVSRHELQVREGQGQIINCKAYKRLVMHAMALSCYL